MLGSRADPQNAERGMLSCPQKHPRLVGLSPSMDTFYHTHHFSPLSHRSDRLPLGRVLPPVLLVKAWLTFFPQMPSMSFLPPEFGQPETMVGLQLISSGATRWRCLPCHRWRPCIPPPISVPSLLLQVPGLPADPHRVPRVCLWDVGSTTLLLLAEIS